MMGLAACTGDTPDGEESAEPTVEEILAQDERFDAPALTAEDRDEICAAVAAALADHYDTGEVPEFTTEIYIPQGTEADSGCSVSSLIWRQPGYQMAYELRLEPLDDSELDDAATALASGHTGPCAPAVTASESEVGKPTPYCRQDAAEGFAEGWLVHRRTKVSVSVTVTAPSGATEADIARDLEEEPELFVAGAETGLDHIMVAIQGFLANR
ncbi:hypothetical protein [Stackebrandtia albiflava]|uniref:hypothetical protein n=1 Tax=Stackebrandtia albiflava TaxID=406432 RepID=UPI0031EFA5D3